MRLFIREIGRHKHKTYVAIINYLVQKNMITDNGNDRPTNKTLLKTGCLCVLPKKTAIHQVTLFETCGISTLNTVKRRLKTGGLDLRKSI